MNSNEISLFLVAEGEVTPADVNAEWDGRESILVAATSAKAAIVVARAYDRGEVIADNLVIDGATIGCVSMRDKDGNHIVTGARFIESEQDWQNGATKYLFRVDGREFCVVESGPDTDYLDANGVPLNPGPDRVIAERECIVTDAMRRNAAGL